MEHVEGHTLEELVKGQGPLPVATACECARQVALGLQRAHEEGMVHRDIKPGNLMLNRRGEVKVLDFGLAKIASEEAGAGPTLTGMMMRTPQYMAPEQARDARSADIRADLYALGGTLFFLLTGKPPFAGRSAYEVMHAHQTQPPLPLEALRPDAPAALAALVRRLLAKRPEDRPQTPDEVAHALAPFCQAEGDGERVTALADPPTLPPARRAGAATTVPQRPAEPRRPRGRMGLALALGAVALAAVGLLALAAGWLTWLGPRRASEPNGPEATAPVQVRQITLGKGNGERAVLVRVGTVEGTVVFQGKPLADAHVLLHPRGGAKPLAARTDAWGKYTVKDVPIGKAAVTVVCEADVARGGPPDLIPTNPKGPARRSLIPTRYADPKTSGLSIDVKAGAQGLNIGLE